MNAIDIGMTKIIQISCSVKFMRIIKKKFDAGTFELFNILLPDSQDFAEQLRKLSSSAFRTDFLTTTACDILTTLETQWPLVSTQASWLGLIQTKCCR